jgi:hypothetical protein
MEEAEVRALRALPIYRNLAGDFIALEQGERLAAGGLEGRFLEAARRAAALLRLRPPPPSRCRPPAAPAGGASQGGALCIQLPANLDASLAAIIPQLPPATTRTILPHSAAASALLANLGAATPSPAQLVGSLLVPALPTLPAAAQQQLLEHVLGSWEALKGDAEVTRALGWVPGALPALAVAVVWPCTRLPVTPCTAAGRQGGREPSQPASQPASRSS